MRLIHALCRCSLPSTWPSLTLSRCSRSTTPSCKVTCRPLTPHCRHWAAQSQTSPWNSTSQSFFFVFFLFFVVIFMYSSLFAFLYLFVFLSFSLISIYKCGILSLHSNCFILNKFDIIFFLFLVNSLNVENNEISFFTVCKVYGTFYFINHFSL